MKQLKICTVLFLFSAVQAYAQTIGTDFLPVWRLMYQPETNTVSTWIRNLSEIDSPTLQGPALFYQTSIEYKRIAKGFPVQDSLRLQAFENPVFNQYISYVDSAFLSATFGNPDRSSPVTVATKFRADSAGFNLSSVGTWFIAEEDTSDIVRVQIRAGGTSIRDAVVVGEGAAHYEIAKSELNGHMYGIELEKPVAIYPNEEFYVVFTYPAGISRPQGCAVNDALPAVKGRYWIERNGEFVDLQQQEGYSHGAWLMYTAEKSPEDIAWLNFVSPVGSILYNPTGSVQASDSVLLLLQLNGGVADLGSQYADIVIHSNDSVNPVIRIPVHLRLNEAPFFLDAPSDLFIKETKVLTVDILLEDYEKDPFEIVPVMGCKFVQFSANDSAMTLKISPQKGDKGDYAIKFKAIDKYEAERELQIAIHVEENQAPYFVDPPAGITLKEESSLEVEIEAADSEGDAFEISMADNVPEFVRFSFEYPKFSLNISPQKGDAGDYAVKIKAVDEYGSTQELQIAIHVEENQAPYFIDPPAGITLKEANSIEVEIETADNEGDAFEVSMADNAPEFVRFSFEYPKFLLNISPRKGDVGDYVVKIKAIDEYGSTQELQMTIHVEENQAPEFIDLPAGISVEEGSTLEIRIEASDAEEDDFEISLTEAPDFVRSFFEHPAITLNLSTQVGQSGEYEIKLLARDTVGSARELTLPVHILHKNRPPVYIRDEEPFTFSFMGETVQYDINEYFEDLENDPFTFEIFCRNSNIVEVTINDESRFTLKPRSVGGTTLDFTLTDARGERAQYAIHVIVGSCEDPSRVIVQKWNKVLLVNNSLLEFAPEGFQWYKNGQPIKNATRQYYSSEDDTGGPLEAGAEYFVRIVKLNGDTIYTCPFVPVQNPAILAAYPNPVERGGILNIEPGSTDFDSGIIQVIDILGNIRKTVSVNKHNTAVQMPETPGFYIVKAVFGNKEDIFRIKVK
jgi:hypothetical protein